MPENNGRSPLRASLMRYARRRYGTRPEYLWLSMPDYACSATMTTANGMRCS